MSVPTFLEIPSKRACSDEGSFKLVGRKRMSTDCGFWFLPCFCCLVKFLLLLVVRHLFLVASCYY